MRLLDACKTHARDLAHLINLAGEGLPEILWRNMAKPGETPMDVGTQRAARDDAAYSYRHARVCVEDGRVLGMLLAFRLLEPDDNDDVDRGLPALRPLIALEAQAAGSWYIKALAALPDQHGRGIARALIADTLSRARDAGCTQTSLIVASENHRAMRVYQHLGFVAEARLPVIPYVTAMHGGDWVLMARALGDDIGGES